MAIEDYFHKLNSLPFQQTSNASDDYNCFAHAMHDSQNWWSPIPGYKWPKANRTQTVAGYVQAFAEFGFEPCDTDAVEAGHEKIAIYEYLGIPTHMARQLPDGTWTSKLGEMEDISHTLDGISGTPGSGRSRSGNTPYGSVAVIIKRRL